MSKINISFNGTTFSIDIYAEAVDVYPCRYTYKATDIEITTDVVSD